VEFMADAQKLTVRDIMNEEVITLPGTATAQEAAQLMRNNGIGSVIVVEDIFKPIGIITERDMNNRVVAENKLPAEIQLKEIMSSPVHIIPPKVLLTDAMHAMSTQHIKRLIVIENSRMIGIISQSDILEIAPYMIEILQERARGVKAELKAEYTEGYCQLCGNWTEYLEEFEGIFVCDECKALKEHREL
jgi:signal-transduction protein with cAMP-binding, CBS, and nucleotidyltransferase domain